MQMKEETESPERKTGTKRNQYKKNLTSLNLPPPPIRSTQQKQKQQQQQQQHTLTVNEPKREPISPLIFDPRQQQLVLYQTQEQQRLREQQEKLQRQQQQLALQQQKLREQQKHQQHIQQQQQQLQQLQQEQEQIKQQDGYQVCLPTSTKPHIVPNQRQQYISHLIRKIIATLQEVKETAGLVCQCAKTQCRACNDEWLESCQTCAIGRCHICRSHHHFERLVKSLHTPRELPDYLEALPHCTAHFDSKKHQVIILSLMSLPEPITWYQSVNGPNMVNLRATMLGVMSKNREYVAPILTVVVNHLTEIPPGPMESVQRKMEADNKLTNTIRMIQEIVKKLPNAHKFLCSQLHHTFPEHTAPLIQSVAYLKNVLRIANTSASMQEKVLSMICDKLVDLDVRLSIEGDWEMDEDEDEEEEEEDMQQALNSWMQFELDDVMKKGGAANRPIDLTDDDQAKQKSLFYALKLDAQMCAVFHYFETCAKLKASSKIMYNIFRSIVNIFNKSILRTHQLHTTQFLMFYICSLDKAYSEEFIQFLLSKVFDRKLYKRNRRISLSYLASFLARAKFLPIPVIAKALHALIGWCEDYMRQSTIDEHQYLLDTHYVFYYNVQCIFYVLCYRIDTLMQEQPQFLNHHGVILQRIIDSPFQPFSHIARDIVLQFARAALHYNLMNIKGAVQRRFEGRKRHVSHHAHKESLMKVYFPFDPYVLSASMQWIHPNYNAWQEHHYNISDEQLMGNNTMESNRYASPKKLKVDHSLFDDDAMSHSFESELYITATPEKSMMDDEFYYGKLDVQ